MRRPLFSLAFVLAFALAFAVSAGEALAARTTVDLNMRAGPGVHYARIGVIPAGHHVEVYGCTGGWCEVNYRGRIGWVSGRYLTDDSYRVYPRVYPVPPYYDGGYYYGWPPYYIYPRPPRPPFPRPPGPPPTSPPLVTPPPAPPGPPGVLPNPPGPPRYWR